MFSSLCPLSLVQSWGNAEENWAPTSHIYTHCWDPPETSLLQAEQSLFCRLLFWQILQILNHLHLSIICLALQWLCGCSFPDAGLHIYFCWISQLAPLTIFPAYKDALESNTTILCIIHSSKFCITCKLAGRGPSAINQVIEKDVTLLVSVLASAAHPSCLISSWSSPVETIWVQQFTQFSIQLTVPLSNLYFTSLKMRMVWQTVSKSLLNYGNNPCSSLTHWLIISL